MKFDREAAGGDVSMKPQRALHGSPVVGTAEEDTGRTLPADVPGEEGSRQAEAGKETGRDKGW